jgi:hypothetical protein
MNEIKKKIDECTYILYFPYPDAEIPELVPRPFKKNTNTLKIF